MGAFSSKKVRSPAIPHLFAIIIRSQAEMLLWRLAAALLGLGLVITAVISAVQTFVLPRAAPDPIVRAVFRGLRQLLNFAVRRQRGFAQRDALMAFYAPVGLLALVPTWLCLIGLGYTALFTALGVRPLYAAFQLSGSSLLTLGFSHGSGWGVEILTFSEAGLGLMMVAILIAYLPTIYAAFARREAAVAMLEVRAGSPASAVEMIKRYHRLHGLTQMKTLWEAWEVWFTDVGESHTSLAALVFFRSPKPQHHWVSAAGAVLDAAALMNAVVAAPHDLQADLTLRAGYLALRSIADYFRVRHNPAPAPGDPISLTRADFDAACADLAAQGVPLRADRDQAWHAFAGWRVNYDTVLLALAEITMAPEAPWIRRPMTG
jgi:hypothetical protein